MGASGRERVTLAHRHQPLVSHRSYIELRKLGCLHGRQSLARIHHLASRSDRLQASAASHVLARHEPVCSPHPPSPWRRKTGSRQGRELHGQSGSCLGTCGGVSWLPPRRLALVRANWRGWVVMRHYPAFRFASSKGNPFRRRDPTRVVQSYKYRSPAFFNALYLTLGCRNTNNQLACRCMRSSGYGYYS